MNKLAAMILIFLSRFSYGATDVTISVSVTHYGETGIGSRVCKLERIKNETASYGLIAVTEEADHYLAQLKEGQYTCTARVGESATTESHSITKPLFKISNCK